MTDDEKARLILTPARELVDEELYEVLVRGVVLAIAEERFKCWEIALKSDDPSNAAIDIGARGESDVVD